MKKSLICAMALPVLLTFVSSTAFAAGDAAAGAKVFRKCQACHSPEPNVNRVGPSLFGVVGRHAGTLAGYHYSSAMKDYDVVWNDETLNTYLEAPQKVVKGTKMTFAGLKDATERADVIAYLNTLK